MTQFGPKLFAFKASRMTSDADDPGLTLERLQSNQARGIETNFVTDNNLMIEVDKACEVERPATDETLAELKLLEWVHFLRACDRQGLHYALTPFFAYEEMPASLARARAARLDAFARKFGLSWHDEESHLDFPYLGRTDLTFEGLDRTQQAMMSLSFSALLLMLVIQRDGAEFSPIGKFGRYLREYKKRIGTVSLREIAIARYVFATQAECPGELDYVRSRIEKNFARKSGKRPRNVEEMYATALNASFDLFLFSAMNVADTHGLEGRPLDCWLVTMDEKLKEYNSLCFNVGGGTGQAGLFTMITSHEEASDYWRKTGEALYKFAGEGSERVRESMRLRARGVDNRDAIAAKIAALPEKARAVMVLARTGL
ncbi:hypothetical protein [Burkholderia gladioli]|uniref:hypothetical protein n=1 Tax=Burkholderia gladioli TaxID=28095 RepID=UPI00163ED789|nr:hypothetical protein [Burkholderia gladioli]